MILVAEFTFREQLLLNGVGPLVTVVLGTLLIGLLVSWITRQAQERREDYLREAQERREDHALRGRLISEVTEAATALYLATQHYWRAKKERLPEDQLKPFREALDDQYLEARRSGIVLEHLLGLHFPDADPTLLMHRVMDLLTVRYFQLVGTNGASQALREANAGEEHSGLSAEELNVPARVLAKYHETLRKLINAIAERELKIPGDLRG